MDNGTSLEAVKAGVPSEIAQTESFQCWHQAQREAGNVLEAADTLWSFRAEDEIADFWAMRVAIRVTAEDRVKANEVVISRPDISAVALYRPAEILDDSIVVLVREFRSTARTLDGFVHELPGGSGKNSYPLAQALSEMKEELGFHIDPTRLRVHGSRQAAATQSTHHVHLYSAEISDAELAILRGQTEAHGIGGTERTWVEVSTFGTLRRGSQVDWSTLGMLSQALLDHRG
jgi:8-oxo-dGTP pyrophosphatase MutT (NUDIX family)